MNGEKQGRQQRKAILKPQMEEADTEKKGRPASPSERKRHFSRRLRKKEQRVEE